MNDPTPIPADTRTLREMLSAQAVADAVAGVFADAAKVHRVTTLKKFTEANAAEGDVSKSVYLPGSDIEVAKATLSKSHDKAIVTDEDAFATWVQENLGADLVEYKPVVKDGTKKALLEKGIEFEKNPETGKLEAISKKTGALVDGVTAVPGGVAKAFTIRDRDLDAIIQWARDNGIDNAMPQITPDAEPAVVASEVVAEDEAGAA